MKRRVAITGIGLVTSLGDDVGEHWRRVLESDSGIREVRKSTDSGLRCFASVDDSFEDALDVKAKKLLAPCSVLAASAAERAIEDSKLDLASLPTDRKGIYVGSGEYDVNRGRYFQPALARSRGPDGSIDYRQLASEGMRVVNPRFLLTGLPNSALCQITIRHAIRGTSSTLIGGSPSGTTAVGRAFRAVRSGRCDVAVCGGSTAPEDPLMQNVLRRFNVLSACEEGPRSFRPFDSACDGYIPGEGTAFLILESLPDARARGARVYGEIMGFGSATDCGGSDYPDVEGHGVSRAIAQALRDSGLTPGQIDHVYSHGVATTRSDTSELSGIERVFQARAEPIPVCSTKPVTGYLKAASDVADIAFATHTLESGLVPPTPNLREVAYASHGVRVVGKAEERHCSNVLCLTRNELGPQVSSIVIGRGEAA